MTVDRITSAQYIQKLRTAILARTRDWDTAFGPILDIVMRPTATILEDQNNNRLRKVSLLMSLLNEDEFSEDDLDALVANEGIIRPEGANATTTLSFTRSTPFGVSESGTIARGWPIGTSIDESTGSSVTFVTTETKDKNDAVAVIDSTSNTLVYKVRVPAICLVTGEAGLVGPNRINRPLRPITGYTSVTNEESTQEGRDRYTNSELIELYLLAVASRQLSVPLGSEFHVRDTFSGVEDVHEVFGINPLLTRAGSDAGAVDSFIIGQSLVSDSDDIDFLGVGQVMQISTPPLVRVDSVVGASGTVSGETFTEGDDYEVIFDTSGVGGSIRAVDGIRFLPTADPMPVPGDIITVTYSYNELIRTLQVDASDEEVGVEGRDLLFRMGTEVPVYLSATLTSVSGFNGSDIQDAVETAISDFINGLGLGDDVEESDIQRVVRELTGVDNLIITKLSDDVEATTVSDVAINDASYARISSANLLVTLSG